MLAAAFLLCDRNFCPMGGSTQTCVLSLVFCSHVGAPGFPKMELVAPVYFTWPTRSIVRQQGITETPVKVKDPVWTCGVYWLTRCLILLCEQFYPYG